MTRLMAHRGARNLWAENSCLGFREVARLGVPAVEFDLHLTDDGQILVIHDATLDRTTTGTGPVRALTGNARHALRLKGPEGEIAEGVPVLAEVLDILAPTGMHLFVELKSDDEGRPYPGLPAMVAEALRRAGVADRCTLTSFDLDVVRDLRDAAPEIPRLVSVNRNWADMQGGLDAFFARLDGLADLVGVHHELFEAEFDRLCTLWPLERLGVWTVNDAELIRHWLHRAPGWLTTDDPVLVQAIAKEGK